jgi:plasmid stabilization system protein ParE
VRIYVFASPRAKAEIDEIVAYLEEYSATAAARFLDALGRTYQMLSAHPEIGPRGERPGTRRLVMGNYIVSYRRKGDEVEIFAVRHARRRDARF